MVGLGWVKLAVSGLVDFSSNALSRNVIRPLWLLFEMYEVHTVVNF